MYRKKIIIKILSVCFYLKVQREPLEAVFAGVGHNLSIKPSM